MTELPCSPADAAGVAVVYTQVETGNPYMLYKDACNRKSNQQNLGTIRCSNLCTEILEFTSPEETAVRFLGCRTAYKSSSAPPNLPTACSHQQPAPHADRTRSATVHPAAE